MNAFTIPTKRKSIHCEWLQVISIDTELGVRVGVEQCNKTNSIPTHCKGLLASITVFPKTLTYNGPFIAEIILRSLSLLCLELIFQFGNNFKTFVFASCVVSKKRHRVGEGNMYVCISNLVDCTVILL